MTFNFAGRRASLGLAACLGHGAKMPRLCFYNQRFASRAPGVDITSGDCSPSAAGNPPAFDAQPRAAACLTARGPASVRSTATSRGALCGGAPELFSASSGSVDRDPLTPLVRRPAWNTASRIPLQSPDPRFAAGTSMAAASHGSRCLPSRETARSALARARRFALLRLAGRCICRASSSMCKTSTRPLVVRFRGRAQGHTRSCDFCRWMPPRARLWTARASRSAKLAGGTTAMLRPEVAFRPGQSPEVLEVRGRATDARHSRSRLRVPETSPQPRSLRAPRVAGAIPGRSGATR
jgi:hypothetical protein